MVIWNMLIQTLSEIDASLVSRILKLRYDEKFELYFCISDAVYSAG